MSLFGDLPAPSRPVKLTNRDDSAIEASLARIKQKQQKILDDEEVIGEEEEIEEKYDDGEEDFAREEEEVEEEEEEEEESSPIETQDLRRRPRPRDLEEEEQQEKPAPTQKRARFDDEVVTAVYEPKVPQPVEDQVAVALCRIASHIRNPSKMTKASPLLRKLLDGDSLSRMHMPQLFEAIRSAFMDPTVCTEPLLRREYMKLIASIASRPDLFGKAEKAHLDVYRVVGHVQNELATDDNFVFNKALGRIRDVVDELSEATSEDDMTLTQLCDVSGGNPWVTSGAAHDNAEQIRLVQLQRLKQEHERSVQLWEEEQRRLDRLDEEKAVSAVAEEGEVVGTNEEADPFGLDMLMAKDAAKEQPRQRTPAPVAPEPPPAAPTTSAWDGQQTACMRREAILQCLKTCQSCHRHAWARTGVELLIEHCHEQSLKFCTPQKLVLEDLMVWVRQQRALRKQGPSAREVNRDSTAFERTRAEWSKATVSARGKVGGGGDSKSNNWLG